MCFGERSEDLLCVGIEKLRDSREIVRGWCARGPCHECADSLSDSPQCRGRFTDDGWSPRHRQGRDHVAASQQKRLFARQFQDARENGEMKTGYKSFAPGRQVTSPNTLELCEEPILAQQPARRRSERNELL